MSAPAPGGLCDKVVLITGSARGQGAVEARRFVAAGSFVIGTDVRTAEGQAVTSELGSRAVFLTHDVADAGSWERVTATAVERFGGIDVLVNNAGIWRPVRIEDDDPENYEQMFRVNLLGTFLGIRAVIATMRARGGGAIVNISSLAGMKGLSAHGAYGASKWGVRGLTKSAALELAPDGIRVNSVHPGAIDTPMIATVTGSGSGVGAPLARLGRSDEVADLVLFLAGPSSSYITGAEFVIDGGGLAQ